MPQPSKFDQHFSRAEQEKIAAYLDDNPGTSVDDFVAHLAERGLPVGRTTAWKEKKRLEDLSRRMRASRLAMGALAENLDWEDETKRSRALIEMGRTAIYDILDVKLRGEADDLDPRDVQLLTRALSNLMRAGRYNQDFEAKHRERVLQEAEEAVDKAARDLERSPSMTPAEMAAAFRRALSEV